VPVERPQVDVAGGAAGRAARTQEPIASRDGGADGRLEQHRHPLGLALVPHGNQVVGVPLGSLATFTAIRKAKGLAAVCLIVGAITGAPPDWRVNNAEIVRFRGHSRHGPEPTGWRFMTGTIDLDRYTDVGDT
jgi:hypothetical protein